ncbi:hypothetical protein Hdeb2414_s0003g00116271 [Helianthus debilis subsp. tardiflorus]
MTTDGNDGDSQQVHVLGSVRLRSRFNSDFGSGPGFGSNSRSLSSMLGSRFRCGQTSQRQQCDGSGQLWYSWSTRVNHSQTRVKVSQRGATKRQEDSECLSCTLASSRSWNDTTESH